ncbi:unnamed protein product [Hydatigera taeniaeformis]|uniref:Uncharacterized protein n=1 Tax=Hydatigena taeniaeformis TaxID=6205 RepID=A0A3P7GVZ9_HYDTA|nr:unnamed protein product [Hydatigera taeniaeformis]
MFRFRSQHASPRHSTPLLTTPTDSSPIAQLR